MQEYDQKVQAIGHFMRLYNDKGAVMYRFQNFYVHKNVKYRDGNKYTFVPFGFSGLSSSRLGDLEPATLIFHSNDISRGYLLEMLGGYEGAVIDQGLPDKYRTSYTAEIDICILPMTADEVEDSRLFLKLFTYTGQATSGGWNDTQLAIELTSVVDAVQDSVPTLVLQQELVGSLPSTSSFGR